jgi:geranylgeranyl diphosphate synthase type II
VFGEGMALLAGDGLLTEAFNVMTAPEVLKHCSAELVLHLVHELAHAVGVAGLVGGQAFDIEAERREVDIGVVEYIHVRKTGALMRACVRLGAQVGRASAAQLRRVSRFGENLGLAFQIADDILDILGESAPGEAAESGNTEWNKATFPSVLGIAAAQSRLVELLGRCERDLAPFGAAAAPLKELSRQIGARALNVNGNHTGKELHG